MAVRALQKQLPSMATLANAGAGFIACALVIAERPELAALVILAAVLLDSVDGALARMLDATSEFGGELDSLADVISFGVAPALLAGSLLPAGDRMAGWAIIACYPVCAAWRLARFNACRGEEGHEQSGFVGLPTTGAGAAAATAALLYAEMADEIAYMGLAFLPVMIAVLGALMVSRLPYRHAGAILGLLRPWMAVLAAAVFVAASVLWRYEYVFGLLMWSYVLSAPLLSARSVLREARQQA